MKTKYFEINKNGHNVRCKLYENGGNIERLILFFHGFAGHKDNKVAEKFAERVLSKNKTAALLIFNWPAHGDDVKKKIALGDCTEYFRIVLDYTRETFGTVELDALATSFGGYMVLYYIAAFGNPFGKIVLRCPAVNMYEILTKTIMDNDDFKKLQKGKTASVGFDRKIEVGIPFLEDLKTADIWQNSYLDFADDMLIIHGTADEVVPFEVVNAFSEDNVIEMIPVAGADHRFQHPPFTEIATKAAINFFGLS
ncbi:MAG: alpha/beta fold hydrolase [Clostridia bacterium]|nr:alpha/beta fold hydrolase [Clostridia bacterium]